MEVLPNELLIQCLRYLNSVDIFQSFDGLNYRFSSLIRHIPLYVDCCDVSKSKFDKFCTILSSNPAIKKQIYSLKLSNKNIEQIQIFNSKFSFDEFSHIRSLSLMDIKEDNIPEIKINLSNLSQLYSFHINKYSCDIDIEEIFSRSSIFQCRILTLPSIRTISDDYLIQFSLVTNLRITHCIVDFIHDLLNHTTQLKYLRIDLLTSSRRKAYENDEDIGIYDQSISLKQITIGEFYQYFLFLAGILKRTPNLSVLTLLSYQDENLFDVHRWEILIRSSLKNLKAFHFMCQYRIYDDLSEIKKIFEQFQSDFWLKEHRWQTECILSNQFSALYTVPYIHNSYTLTTPSTRFYNQTINRFPNTFANVKHLKLELDIVNDHYPCYFPCVTSIEFNQTRFDEEYYKFLKKTVNLTNLNSLCLSSNCQLENPLILIQIFEQSSNLSSLSIDKQTLVSLIDNDQLCVYLSKMIKKLILTTETDLSCAYILESKGKSNYIDLSSEEFYRMNKFWKTFVNIEELECEIERRQSIRFLFESLPKLSYLNIHSITKQLEDQLEPFAQKTAHELDIQIITKIKWITNGKNLDIWITR